MANEHIKEVAEELIKLKQESDTLNRKPANRERFREIAQRMKNLLLSVDRVTDDGRDLENVFQEYPEVIKIYNKLKSAVARIQSEINN